MLLVTPRSLAHQTSFSSLQLAFASRVKLYLSWQTLEAESRRLRSTLERNRAGNRIAKERMGMEIQIVAEVRSSPIDRDQLARG